MNITNNIFRTLYAEKSGENFVFSPYSYLSAIHTLFLCISGLNESELKEVFAKDGFTKELFKQKILNSSKIIEKSDSFFCDDEYFVAIKNDFLELIKTEDVSFKGFSGKIDLCGKLNKLADEKTHGLIKEFVRPDQLDDLIKFVITNVIYFKDDWLNKLDETSSEYNFYGSKQTVSRKFLGRHDHLAYYEDAQVQIVELPFKNSAATCRIYVPRENLFGLVDGLEKTLNKGGLCKKDGIKVDFYCPPFKVETTIDNLAQLTRNQGITRVFSPSKDWSFLDFDKLDSAAVVWIEAIKQKAVFDFTEKGVEAAAMTGMFLYSSGCMMMPEKKVTIRANKPFLFTLNHENDILFVGVINNIEGSSEVIRESNQERFNFTLDNPLGATGVRYFDLRPLVGDLK